MFRAIHIYDVDGVLLDSSHRYRNKPCGNIDLDYWFANLHLRDDDKPLPMLKKFRRDCEASHIYVIVLTARAYSREDYDSLVAKLGAMPNRIIMRPAGNMEADWKLKRRYLQRIVNLKQFRHLPRFLWEDNLQNIYGCANLITRAFHIPSRITHNAS